MNERIAHIFKSPWTIPSAVGVVAFGGGVGLGYILGKRKAEKDLDAQFTNVSYDEVKDYLAGDGDDEVHEFFDTEGMARQRVIIDEEAYHSPAVIPETDAEIGPNGDTVIVRPQDFGEEHLEDDISEKSFEEELREGTPHEDTEEPDFEPVHVNVFDDGNWDWEIEVAAREALNPGTPYILHRDEFYRNEFDYTQTTLAYYEGDETVVVEGEQEPLFDFQRLTGELNFGHGSGDPNVVLIRNDERRAEYEICRNEGHFAKEVLGYEAEQRAEAKDLKHSRVGRFRDED